MLRRIVIAAVAVCALGTVHIQAQKNEFFRPKEVWNDTEGNPINAHGGGILYHKGTYYWYGEYKVGKTVLPSDATWERYRTDVTGVSCYSSKDLLNWKFEGVALKAITDDPNSDSPASASGVWRFCASCCRRTARTSSLCRVRRKPIRRSNRSSGTRRRCSSGS